MRICQEGRGEGSRGKSLSKGTEAERGRKGESPGAGFGEGEGLGLSGSCVVCASGIGICKFGGGCLRSTEMVTPRPVWQRNILWNVGSPPQGTGGPSDSVRGRRKGHCTAGDSQGCPRLHPWVPPAAPFSLFVHLGGGDWEMNGASWGWKSPV